MRFYTHQHKFYCGIDLHARSMYVCIINQDGEILVHRNLPARPDRFLKIIEPYRDDLVVAVECMFTWYWLADLCAQHQITFVLGHALYMKAIHGGKSKNDRIDAHKNARRFSPSLDEDGTRAQMLFLGRGFHTNPLKQSLNTCLVQTRAAPVN